MKKTNLNLDWLFMNGEKSNIPMMPQQTKKVNLPHDFMVETDVTPDAPGKAESGFYKGSAGTYLKTITLTEEEMTDTMLLHFEGCFGKTRVLINGNPAGSHVYGYTPFISASFYKSAIMRYRSSFIPMMSQTDDGIRAPECIVVSTS